jgi:hypothetical protein
MSQIHHERLIITTDRDNAIKSATVFPIEYFTETDARPLPPLDLDSTELVGLKDLFSSATITQRDALDAKVTALTTERDQLNTERDQLATERDSLTAQLQSTATELSEAQTSLVASANEVTTLTSRLDDAATQVAQRDATILSLQDELNALLNPPGPDLTTRDGVRQFVSDSRYVVETRGIYVGEQFISTERDEIGHWFPRFYNALMWLQGDPRIKAVNPQGLYPFKPKSHPPTVLTAEQVLRAYECMAWFINACFAEEAVLYARLDANEPLDVIVTETPSAWPSNRFTWEPPA